jgi:P27 family predicted phage terminase small subunit
MATAGRKPTPTKLKLLKGNPGGRPVNTQEPKPTPKAPQVPTWLSPEAKQEWKRVVPELDRLGLLTLVDRSSLSAYCESWATFVKAQKDVTKRGVLVTGYRGSKVKNPSLQIARDAMQAIRGFAAEFGLTPSARTRLTIDEHDDDDGLAGILSGTS